MWELIGIDLTGPLPKTSSGFQYILTATDYFSKWVEAFPLKSKSASEVAQHLCAIIYRHGCPKRILSDQGREFVNEVSVKLYFSYLFLLDLPGVNVFVCLNVYKNLVFVS